MAPEATSNSPGIFGRVRNFGRRVVKEVRDTFTRIANNIESIILYSRLKDFYKLLEFGGLFLSAGLVSWFIKDKDGILAKDKMQEAAELERRALELEQKAYGFGMPANKEGEASGPSLAQRLDRIESHLKESAGNLQQVGAIRKDIAQLRQEAKELQRQATITTGRITDVIFGAFTSGISYFSNWVDKKGVTRTYDNIIADELGIHDRDITFQDARRSTNPIIKIAADYYNRKSIFRQVTDLPALARFFVPEVNGKDVSGMRAAIGSKTAFFA
ncbi:MAG: hypothetical protein KDK34_18720, partial [Leptospiraceae bacterium]|nr:hypothetical protein [Leptospiraceae bacterium]